MGKCVIFPFIIFTHSIFIHTAFRVSTFHDIMFAVSTFLFDMFNLSSYHLSAFHDSTFHIITFLFVNIPFSHIPSNHLSAFLCSNESRSYHSFSDMSTYTHFICDISYVPFMVISFQCMLLFLHSNFLQKQFHLSEQEQFP